MLLSYRSIASLIPNCVDMASLVTGSSQRRRLAIWIQFQRSIASLTEQPATSGVKASKLCVACFYYSVPGPTLAGQPFVLMLGLAVPGCCAACLVVCSRIDSSRLACMYACVPAIMHFLPSSSLCVRTLFGERAATRVGT